MTYIIIFFDNSTPFPGINALLPTLGGQTGLNTAMELVRRGILEKNNVKLIGANAEAIEKGEDRLAFKEAMIKIGLDIPQSGVAHTMDEAIEIAKDESLEQITEKLNYILEKMVLKNPEQWILTHNRWKL